jgi:hypothetical protein
VIERAYLLVELKGILVSDPSFDLPNGYKALVF